MPADWDRGVGDGGAGDGAGDGGKARDAVLRFPTGLAVSPDGTLYFSDDLGTEGGGGFRNWLGANRVRKVARKRRMVTAAFGEGAVYPDVPRDDNSLLHWPSADFAAAGRNLRPIVPPSFGGHSSGVRRSGPDLAAPGGVR